LKNIVIPAMAGIQDLYGSGMLGSRRSRRSRLRGNDRMSSFCFFNGLLRSMFEEVSPSGKCHQFPTAVEAVGDFAYCGSRIQKSHATVANR